MTDPDMDCGAWYGGVNEIACLLPTGHDGKHAAPWADEKWTDEEAQSAQESGFAWEWGGTTESIPDIDEAQRFISEAERVIGAGFHPDTRFADYVRSADGSAIFTEEDAAGLEVAMEEAFRVFRAAGEDIYGWSLEEHHRMNPESASA